MDSHSKARNLLDRFDVLRHASDLDLLIFFARHPTALLTTEQIAMFLGYEPHRIVASLELLLEARLLTRTPHPRHAARLYVFAVTNEGGGWLAEIMQLAGTRQGRLALIEAINDRWSGPTGKAAPGNSLGTSDAPLPFRGRAKVDGTSAQGSPAKLSIKADRRGGGR